MELGFVVPHNRSLLGGSYAVAVSDYLGGFFSVAGGVEAIICFVA